jgi:hypothetical protein
MADACSRIDFACHVRPRKPAARPREHSPAEFALICAVRAAATVAGMFMLRRQEWARWLALAWFGFHVVISGLHAPMKFAFHVVLFIVVAYFLLRPLAWSYFKPPGDRPNDAIRDEA